MVQKNIKFWTSKKNLIIISIFFLFISLIGESYAFFSFMFKNNRRDENTNLTTGNISNTTIVSNIPNGIGSFLNQDIYPGHKEVLGFSVTGSGEVDSKSYFEFKYRVSENGLGRNVKVSVYRSFNQIEIQENHFQCEKKQEKIENSNNVKYYETCMEKELGLLLEETILNGGKEEVTIGKDVLTIKNENMSVTKYYYVILEFINQDSPQNEDMNRSLVGKVSVELTTPFERDYTNNIEGIVSSKTESWSKQENFSIHVTSEKYRIVAISEDLESWEELKEKEKDITIEKTVMENGTYHYYFQDEAENIKEVIIEATKIDNEAPILHVVAEEYFDGIKIDASSSIDDKSEVKMYYFKLNEGEYIESTDATYIFSDLSDGTYKITMKIEDNVGNMSEEKEVEIVHRRIYKESILNGTIPILKDELLPVTIANDGTVKKADLRSEWYKYEEKKWANAIILKNKSISYSDNEIIPEGNIESYFVWIPKYRYRLWNLTNYANATLVDIAKVHTISLIFGDYNTKDSRYGECTTPMTSGNTGNCEVGDYMTHPAFLSIPSTGFWVGKFETSKSNNQADNSINSNGIQIKPNVTSWRNIQISNAFYTTYDYKRNLDSHMMKNTEWGAVAYLQHSAYGSHTSVRYNNHSNNVTGYAGVVEPSCGFTNDNRDCNQYGNTNDITRPYNTATGYFSSTTGNISGIYDMSGGAWEYVMGVMVDINGNPYIGKNGEENSGFNGRYGEGGSLTVGKSLPSSRYYDTYAYAENVEIYSRRILGDATGEMGPFQSVSYNNNIENRIISSWYKDSSYSFVYPIKPWFARGARYNHGSETGVFAFLGWQGYAHVGYGFRIVLTPNT